jgi:hypothetical protein
MGKLLRFPQRRQLRERDQFWNWLHHGVGAGWADPPSIWRGELVDEKGELVPHDGEMVVLILRPPSIHAVT